MQKICIIFIFTLFCFSGYTQKSTSNYVILGNKTISGVKLLGKGDLSNYNKITVNFGDSVATYKPSDLAEYGFKGGPVYISADLEIYGSTTSVFLERITQGELSLFRFQDDISVFFILHEDNVYTLLKEYSPEGEKNVFQKQLKETFSGFPEITGEASLIPYNQNSLAKYISSYNDRKWKPANYLKYGFTAGYAMSRIYIPGDPYQSPAIKADTLKMAGYYLNAFLDLPIAVSDFAFHIEFIYSLLTEQDSESNTLYILPSYEVPIIFRYYYPLKNVRPYLGAGTGIKIISDKFEALPFTKVINKLQVPGFLEAGAAIPLIDRIQGIIGIRLSKSYSVDLYQKGFKMNTLTFYGGLSF